jgi:hypothetical protein
VGNSEFTNMEVLDGDNGLVDSRGQKSKRDCVQFVPFRNFQGNADMLAKAVLAEIPEQVVEYMRLIGKPPNAPKFIDVNQIQFNSMAGGVFQSNIAPVMTTNPEPSGLAGLPPGGLFQSQYAKK